MTDLLGLKPIFRLIEAIGRGAGNFLEPFHIKNIAKAEAKARETIAEARAKETKIMAEAKAKEAKIMAEAFAENITFPINYKNGKVEMSSADHEELVKRASNRFFFQEIQKQQNMESVIGYAYTELENDTELSNEKVETDLILRFMNSVEDISNEQMQQLWGKILAEEVRRPRTFSLRTLDIIRNISTHEAQQFEKLSNYMIYIYGKLCIYATDIFFENYINYSTFLLLGECGLINPNPIQLKPATGEDGSSIHNSQILGLISKINSEAKNIDLRVFSLSEAGRQLYNSIYKNKVAEIDFLLEVFKEVNKRFSDKDYKFSIYKITNMDSQGGVTYKPKDIKHLFVKSE